MAYMGRGGFSSFRSNSDDGKKEYIDREGYYGGGYFFRPYYYVPLDNTYVIFQIVASILIFIIAVITFLIVYKPSITDPIEDIKKMFLNTYVIIVLALVVITFLVNCFSKSKKNLLNCLTVLLLISIITLMIFFGIKLNMDSTYTKNRFEQIYTQEYGNQKANTRNRLDIGLNKMQIITEKEFFVDECIKAYDMFSTRMYGISCLYALLIILLSYQIIKVSKIQEKKDKLSRDDAILFDEEENIKF